MSEEIEIVKLDVPSQILTYVPSVPTIGICRELPARKMIQLASEHGLWHLVHESEPFFDQEIKTSELMIRELQTFLNFPISSVLNADQAGRSVESQYRAMEFTFTKASQKSEVLEKVELLLAVWKKRTTIVHELLMVADEIFTNAAVNAPKDAQGLRANEPLKPARFFMGRDDDRIVIGCEDLYGTLDLKSLIERLNLCYSSSSGAPINWHSGGAGIGTYMIFQSVLGYYAAVEEGSRTVVCCTFSNSARRSRHNQNIHLSGITLEERLA